MKTEILKEKYEKPVCSAYEYVTEGMICASVRVEEFQEGASFGDNLDMWSPASNQNVW